VPVNPYEQVIDPVALFGGELESRTTTVVGPLRFTLLIIVEPPLVVTVCGTAIPDVGLTL